MQSGKNLECVFRLINRCHGLLKWARLPRNASRNPRHAFPRIERHALLREQHSGSIREKIRCYKRCSGERQQQRRGFPDHSISERSPAKTPFRTCVKHLQKRTDPSPIAAVDELASPHRNQSHPLYVKDAEKPFTARIRSGTARQ